MIEQAKAKLQAEMDGSKDDAYIQYVGNFLVSHIDANPQDAEKIIAADKTIAKSMEAMRTEASKKKKGNMAMLTPNEGLAVVLKYFGITGKPSIPSSAPAAYAAAAAPASSGSDFNVSLDEFGL